MTAGKDNWKGKEGFPRFEVCNLVEFAVNSVFVCGVFLSSLLPLTVRHGNNWVYF